MPSDEAEKGKALPVKQAEGVWEPYAGRAPISCRPTCRRRPPLAYAANTGRRVSAPSSIRGSILPRPAHRLTTVRRQAASHKAVQGIRACSSLGVGLKVVLLKASFELGCLVQSWDLCSDLNAATQHGMLEAPCSLVKSKSCNAICVTPGRAAC